MGSDLLTCEVHLLPFSEHLVAANTSGTGGVVVLPSCLRKEKEGTGGQGWGRCPVGMGLNISQAHYVVGAFMVLRLTGAYPAACRTV